MCQGRVDHGDTRPAGAVLKAEIAAGEHRRPSGREIAWAHGDDVDDRRLPTVLVACRDAHARAAEGRHICERCGLDPWEGPHPLEELGEKASR